MSINAAHDEALLARLARAGCAGVLIGFESLDEQVLRSMRKNFNRMKGGYGDALANLRRANIRVYGTFVFGYGATRAEAFLETAEFATANCFCFRSVRASTTIRSVKRTSKRPAGPAAGASATRLVSTATGS